MQSQEHEGGDVALRVKGLTNTIMALAQNPVTGQMAGSFANVNTYVCKGQNVVSSKVFNRKDKKSVAQMLQRSIFKLMSDMYVELGGFGDIGFPQRNARQSAHNTFIKVNLRSAIDYSGDGPKINYSELKVAQGSLPNVTVEDVSLTEAGIHLECETNFKLLKSVATDQIYLLVKRKGKTLKVEQVERGDAERVQIDMALPGITKEEIDYIYLFLVSADGTKASNSMLITLP